MRNEFTAIIERDEEWYIAYCPEIPGANGQGQTKEQARASLAEAIALILEDRREDALRGVPPEAERATVIVEPSSDICAETAATSSEKEVHTRYGAIQPPALSRLSPGIPSSQTDSPGKSVATS